MDVKTRYIGRKELREISNVSYQTWWRLEKAKLAPARVRLSAGRVGWLLSDVLAWCKSRQVVGESYEQA